jgi:hypothetical protein
MDGKAPKPEVDVRGMLIHLESGGYAPYPYLRFVFHAELEEEEDVGVAPDSFEAFLARAEAREVLLKHRQKIIGTSGKPRYYQPKHGGDKRSATSVEEKAD